MIPNPQGGPWIRELNRLRWLGVWLPVTALAALIALAEGLVAYLDLPWRMQIGAHGVMLGLIAAGAFGFSTYIFEIVRRKETEILQKQQELAAMERRFRALIENSSDGTVLLNANGVYTYASPATSRILGYAVEELVGRSAFEFIHPDDREHAIARTLESLRNPDAVVRAEVRIRHRDGSWRWMEAAVSNLLADPSVQAIVKNYRDITERKQGEEALRKVQGELEVRVRERTAELVRTNDTLCQTLAERQQAEEALHDSQKQLAGIIASAMDGIITMDEDQRIVVFNAAAERMFHVSAADAIGRRVQQFIPERFRRTHQSGLRDFSRSNLEKWWVGMLWGATASRPDGGEFPFEAAISQVEVGGRKLFTIILHDISAQKQAEEQLRTSGEQLRALAAHLQSVREEERARIAREIQERFGQALAVLKMDLAWLANRLPADRTALVEKSKAMLGIINSTIHSVRRIATELRPGVLDDLGLVAAIEWQAREFQARTAIGCEFTAEPADTAVAPDVGVALFRICQETLTNVARHANATKVSVCLQGEPGALTLIVADDGRGITEEEVANRTSLGLFGMRERVLLMGGELSIVGRPGGGTTVTVRIPLNVANGQEVSETPNPMRGLTP